METNKELGYSLREMSQEELTAFNTDLEAVIAKHEVQVQIIPVFAQSGKHYVIDGQLLVQKKVALVAKDNGETEEQPSESEAPKA